jgi:hypothetical protein
MEKSVPASAMEHRVVEIEGQLAFHRRALQELELERDILRRWLNSAAAPKGVRKTGRRARTSPKSPSESPSEKLGTTPALLHVVRGNPGLPQHEIVRRAVKIVNSPSGNPKQNLSSTLSKMIKAKKYMYKRGDGVYPVEGSGNGNGQEHLPLAVHGRVLSAGPEL